MHVYTLIHARIHTHTYMHTHANIHAYIHNAYTHTPTPLSVQRLCEHDSPALATMRMQVCVTPNVTTINPCVIQPECYNRKTLMLQP